MPFTGIPTLDSLQRQLAEAATRGQLYGEYNRPEALQRLMALNQNPTYGGTLPLQNTLAQALGGEAQTTGDIPPELRELVARLNGLHPGIQGGKPTLAGIAGRLNPGFVLSGLTGETAPISNQAFDVAERGVGGMDQTLAGTRFQAQLLNQLAQSTGMTPGQGGLPANIAQLLGRDSGFTTGAIPVMGEIAGNLGALTGEFNVPGGIEKLLQQEQAGGARFTEPLRQELLRFRQLVAQITGTAPNMPGPTGGGGYFNPNG